MIEDRQECQIAKSEEGDVVDWLTSTANSIRAVALVLGVAGLSSIAHAQVHNNKLDLTSDPLSCSRLAADFLSTPVCKYDLGAYQVARLALSIEMLASALQVSGLKSSTQDLQAQLLSDVGRFGVQAAIVMPAIAASDLASVSRSPFGASSSTVQARSILALEYLIPGIAQRAGLPMDSLMNNAGVLPADGPMDFSAYMSAFAGKSIDLSSFRRFTSPEGSRPIATKLGIPDSAFAPGVPRNAASDIKFPAAAAVKGVVPYGMLYVGVAGSARLQGRRLFADQAEIPATSAAPFPLPFGGASCAGCKSPAGAPGKIGSMFPTSLSAAPAALGRLVSPTGLPSEPGQPRNGTTLLEAERFARRDLVGKQSAMGAAKSMPSDEGSPMGTAARVSCELACAAKETVRTLGMALADASNGLSKIKDGDSAGFSNAVDKYYYNVINNFQNGGKDCKTNCETTGNVAGVKPGAGTGGDGKGGDGKGGDGKGGDGKGGDGKGGDGKGGDGKGGDGKGGDGKGGDGKGGDGKGGDGKGGDGKGGDGKGGDGKGVKTAGMERVDDGSGGSSGPSRGAKVAPSVGPQIDVQSECRKGGDGKGGKTAGMERTDCDCLVSSSGVLGKCGIDIASSAVREQSQPGQRFFVPLDSETSRLGVRTFNFERGQNSSKPSLPRIEPYTYPGQNTPAYSQPLRPQNPGFNR